MPIDQKTPHGFFDLLKLVSRNFGDEGPLNLKKYPGRTTKAIPVD
jgi:hypothetical protein